MSTAATAGTPPALPAFPAAAPHPPRLPHATVSSSRPLLLAASGAAQLTSGAGEATT